MILAFCPTYSVSEGKLAVRPETLHSLDRQTHTEYAALVSTQNPYPAGDMRNVLHQYQCAREIVLSGGFDALWTIEHDMIVPLDALEIMDKTDADVIYGVYLLRHGSYMLNALRWTMGQSPDSSLSLWPDLVKQAFEQKIYRVSGVGFGCTLIRSHVLKKFEFHASSSDTYAPDTGFAGDCHRAGLMQVARFDVPCGHIEGEEILTVDKSRSATTICKILKTVVIQVEGETVRLNPGDRVNLPLDQARELERAGYLEFNVYPVPSFADIAEEIYRVVKK